MRRLEGPYRFIPKRPPTFVLASEGIAAARVSKIGFREIFGGIRFSTFATISAKLGHDEAEIHPDNLMLIFGLDAAEPPTSAVWFSYPAGLRGAHCVSDCRRTTAQFRRPYARCARTDNSRDCEKLPGFTPPPISRTVSSVESYRLRRQERRQVHVADKASSEATPCSARRGYFYRAGFPGSLSRKQAKR